jgi:Cdc6-like AAA superfamily ATPase
MESMMDNNLQSNIDDAFNSMLRTDYIPLRDTSKLQRLSRYYVDYFGYLRQIVGESDQLIVGRRGTGKTTLLYRALIECIHSWNSQIQSRAKRRTLAVYLDLSKCQTLSDTSASDFAEFEHVFVSELVDTIKEELVRSWPDLGVDQGIFARIFSRDETRRNAESRQALKKLAAIILSGIPRNEEDSGPRKYKQKEVNSNAQSRKVGGGITEKGLGLTAEAIDTNSSSYEQETEATKLIRSRLAISDILRVLGELRDACEMSHIVILVDEFSSLSSDLQRRFSTLLRKILGNHSGVYLKVCAITDNYSLGSTIILQRDIFQLSLDLDSFVERSDNLNSAMDSLRELTRDLVSERIKEYTGKSPSDLFENPEQSWIELSRAAMGVPSPSFAKLKQSCRYTRSKLPRKSTKF